MSDRFSPDVAALIQQQMATGRFASEDDLLREALERLADDAIEDDCDLAAILEGLDEVDRGVPGIPLEEARQMLLQNLAEDKPA
jgi:Arc/MetJ-type ribon-helix-helix transcriptional regulator